MRSLLVLILLVPASLRAADGSIVQVTRRTVMSARDQRPTKDFFIDRGSRHGVKTGDVYRVLREMSVVDGRAGGQSHLVRVHLGDLKVIELGETASLGRVTQLRPAKELPAMDYPTFLVGDLVEKKAETTNLPTR